MNRTRIIPSLLRKPAYLTLHRPLAFGLAARLVPIKMIYYPTRYISSQVERESFKKSLNLLEYRVSLLEDKNLVLLKENQGKKSLKESLNLLEFQRFMYCYIVCFLGGIILMFI